MLIRPNNDSKIDITNFFEKRTPHRVKEQEQERINAAYLNLNQLPDKSVKAAPFTLSKDVKYLWVYTANKEVILGVEDAWNCRSAFSPMSDAAWEKISQQLKEGGELGHPTQAAFFDAQSGKVCVGQAYVGGELAFHVDENKWVLNNISGRFGRLPGKNKENIQLLLEEVVSIVNNKTDVNADVAVMIKTPNVPARHPINNVEPQLLSDTRQTVKVKS